MTALLVIVLSLVALVLVFAAVGVKIIKQAETMVIERLGTYHRTLTSGVHIIWPFVDRARSIDWRVVSHDRQGSTFISYIPAVRIDLRETVFDFPRQNVITRDNVVTEINALLYFQVIDPKRAVYEVMNLPQAIEKLTQTTLRNVIGEMDLDETLSSRDKINTKLRGILDQATEKWGVKVTRVELQDINPPKDIRDAMEKQMRAERDRRATILEAEGTKRSQILQAEGQKEAAINQAQGRKEAAILEAEGIAQARIRVAEAEAEAIRRITAALATIDSNPANYLIAMKYIETLREMVSGKENKVVYLPYEASAVLGAIGGVKNLFDVSPKAAR
jgi:regulator of protease activity HflC (stomatin/prohibitin superfamily)